METRRLIIFKPVSFPLRDKILSVFFYVCETLSVAILKMWLEGAGEKYVEEEISNLKCKKEEECREICIMRNFILCQILLA